MEWIISNIDLIAIIGIKLAAIGYGVYYFLSLPTDKRKDQIRVLLLSLVIESEKLFGSKTGKIKFSYVYSQLIIKLPQLRFIPLSVIESLIEESLQEMKHLLETNPKVAEIVGEK